MADRPFATFVAAADRAIVCPASYGTHSVRGYLLYWIAGESEMVDSWTTYKNVAAAAQVAQQQRPGIEVVYAKHEHERTEYERERTRPLA